MAAVQPMGVPHEEDLQVPLRYSVALGHGTAGMAPVVMGGPELSTVDAGRDAGGVDAEDSRRFAGTQTRFSRPHVHPPAGADLPPRPNELHCRR